MADPLMAAIPSRGREGMLFEDFLVVGLERPAAGGPLELKIPYHLHKDQKAEDAKAIVEVRREYLNELHTLHRQR